MKIAISSEGKNIKSPLDMRFGRCSYFQIYNTDSGEIEVLENKGKTSNSAAGIAASNQLIDEKVDVIITGHLGPNAFKLIEKCGIKAYKCENIPVMLALENIKMEN
jgi:predicted Fe-Mo cluster-binding NifX family protein